YADGMDPATETLVLQDESGDVRVKVVCGDRREMLDPEETVRFWSSSGYLAEYMDDGTRVALADRNRCAGAVVMVGPGEDGGEPVVTMKETYATGYRTSVRVTLTAPLESFVDAYR